MAEEFLNRADVRSLLQEMCGERVAQSETTSSLRSGRSVWGLAGLAMPAARTARLTAFCTADGDR